MRAIYLGLLVAIAGVVLALAFLSASPHIHPSQTVYLNTVQSGCTAHLNQFNCTLILSSRLGALSTTQISGVIINDTRARTSVTSLGNGSFSVEADITLTTMGGGLQDVNNFPPSSSGAIVVYLTDGTTVSATLPGEYRE